MRIERQQNESDMKAHVIKGQTSLNLQIKITNFKLVTIYRKFLKREKDFGVTVAFCTVVFFLKSHPQLVHLERHCKFLLYTWKRRSWNDVSYCRTNAFFMEQTHDVWKPQGAVQRCSAQKLIFGLTLYWRKTIKKTHLKLSRFPCFKVFSFETSWNNCSFTICNCQKKTRKNA